MSDITINMTQDEVMAYTRVAETVRAGVDPLHSGVAQVMADALAAVGYDNRLREDGLTVTFTASQATSALLGLMGALPVIRALGETEHMLSVVAKIRDAAKARLAELD